MPFPPFDLLGKYDELRRGDEIGSESGDGGRREGGTANGEESMMMGVIGGANILPGERDGVRRKTRGRGSVMAVEKEEQVKEASAS